MKKRFLAVVAILAMAVTALCGCGKKTAAGYKEYDAAELVTLGDYMNMEVNVSGNYEVNEDSIQSQIEDMLIEAGLNAYEVDNTQTVVKKDSIVNVDYSGIKDGVAFDGGTAEDVILDIATNSTPGSSTYIDGFSEGLVGSKVGDTVDCDVTFPENYGSEELAGQQVIFRFKVNSILKAVDVSELSMDEIQSYFGEEIETKEDLEAYAKSIIEENGENDYKNDVANEILSNLMETCSVKEIPSDFFEYSVEEYLNRYAAAYCSDGQTVEQYIKSAGGDYMSFKAGIESDLTNSLTQQLILQAIAEKEGIEITDKDLKEYNAILMENYGYAGEDEIYGEYNATNLEAGKDHVKRIVLCNKVIDYLIDNVKVNKN